MKSTRTELYKALPLSNPFLVQIFPSYACNFKCGYCLHFLPREQHGFISSVTNMDFELYKRAIDDMANAGWKLKMLRFAALGEPLLHPQIADMVKYAVDLGVAETVDIVTNGALLSHNMSDALIDAGLSTLRISLEGLSSEEYLKNCGADIDFDKLRANIEYFYNNSKNTEVYVKIIDYMLEGTGDKEKQFNDLFKPICNRIAIEHLTPTVENIDYSKISNDIQNLTQEGTELLTVKICPQPFYMMQINPDGNIVPCCSTEYPLILGNSQTDGAVNAWNGAKFTEFRLNMLDGASGASAACAKCSLYRYGTFSEDVLDGYESYLKERYKNL